MPFVAHPFRVVFSEERIERHFALDLSVSDPPISCGHRNYTLFDLLALRVFIVTVRRRILV